MSALPPEERRELVRFLVVALGVGVVLQLPAFVDPRFLGLGLLLMWVPALAVVVAGKGARQEAKRRLARPWPWWTMLLASVLGWFHKVASGLLGVAVGASRFDARHFALEGGRVVGCDFVWLFPAGGEPLSVFLLHLFVMQLVGVAIVGPLMAFGEEIGWRGFLQWRLASAMGLFRGTLVVGLIWGFWHAPFVLAGHNGGGVLHALVFFPLELVVASFLYAWLVHRTGSVLPAICAHAANNSFPADKLFTTVSPAREQAVSVAATLLLACVVLALFRAWPPSERAPRLHPGS